MTEVSTQSQVAAVEALIAYAEGRIQKPKPSHLAMIITQARVLLDRARKAQARETVR